MQDLYHQILSSAQRLVKPPDAMTHYGSELGLAESLVVAHSKSFEVDGGRLKITLSTPESRPPTEWLAEITIDRMPVEIKHYLLRTNGELVEAYGRKVFNVELDSAESLAQELKELS